MQQVWRKRWRNTAWCALAIVTLVLLVSAVYKKNNKACTGVEVTFKGDGSNFFIEEKGVVALLKANGLVIGQPVEAINLKALEETLKRDKWIANAELFFDNNQALQVVVEEKSPVARIFTVNGSSFYIDSACRKLPLSEKLSARIPMFTNFPTDRVVLSKPDSELLASVKDLAMFIQADELWKAQVAQIDITPDGFEMIPTVGDHVVMLGEGIDYQQKFDRLFSFYKEVWPKVGFEKYEKVDVRFNGQVVATLKGAKPAVVDSQKVRVAYEKLIAEARRPDDNAVSVAEGDGANDGEVKAAAVSKVIDTDADNVANEKETSVKAAGRKQGARTNISKGIRRKQAAPLRQVGSNRQVQNKRAPKAVMRKRAR